MLKSSTVTKTLLVVAFIAAALTSAILFGLARSTDNGPLSTAPIFSFAAAGDFGYNNNTRAVLKEIDRQNTDFTLALGDLSYGKSSEKEWCDMVTSVVGKDYPFQLIAGNHDDKEGSTFSKFAACLPNKLAGMQGDYGLQYAFDYKNTARIIAISPGLTVAGKKYTYTSGTAEYDWLVRQIEDARNRNTRWTIVAMHEVCVTLGEKVCEIDPALFSLLVEKKVDLVLQGHEHGYMRTKQLSSNTPCPTGSTGTLKEICTVATNEKTHYQKGKGPVIAINGSGGVELRPINLTHPDLSYFADWHGSNAQPVYGPLIVSVWADKLEARFVDPSGKEHDRFVISSPNSTQQ